MKWLDKLFTRSTAKDQPAIGPTLRKVTAKSPLVIQSPRIGFLNLLGSQGQQLIEEDKQAIASLFSSISQSDAVPPVCDALMMYARISKDGRIEGSPEEFRSIIFNSQAPIVIVASNNPGENYIAAGKRGGSGRANLVMTLDRRGELFPQFFSQLFNKMFEGKSMPMAWVELAPQIPGAVQENCPSTIFAAEVSHIIFRR